MGYVKIPFPRLEWASAAPGERKKTAAVRHVAMLEFAPGFADPCWCPDGHIALVLSGVLEIEFECTIESFMEDDSVVIDPGTRHRARNPGKSPVQLFIMTKS